MVASGFSTWQSVSPGWPFWPPVFLPDDSRKLLTRGAFLNPSLDGGLPLLLLFSPRRRSNSAMRRLLRQQQRDEFVLRELAERFAIHRLLGIGPPKSCQSKSHSGSLVTPKD
jgi:hypothetical protein